MRKDGSVGSALEFADEDEESYASDLVKPRPYNANPIDPATLPVDRKERLKAVEAALMSAQRTMTKSVAWSKLRWTVETGVALGVLIGEDLYKEDPEFTSLETYADNRLHLSRGHVYELIEDASRLLAVAPLSEISDKPFNPSQAKVLAPLMEVYSAEGGANGEIGRTKAELVIADVDATGKKRTATALKKAAEARGFAVEVKPALPPARTSGGGKSETDGIEDAQVVETDETRALDRLHGLLLDQESVYDGIGDGLLSLALKADPAAADAILREFLQHLNRTEHRIRTALKAVSSDAA